MTDPVWECCERPDSSMGGDSTKMPSVDTLNGESPRTSGHAQRVLGVSWMVAVGGNTISFLGNFWGMFL